jgi:hypothetical protein
MADRLGNVQAQCSHVADGHYLITTMLTTQQFSRGFSSGDGENSAGEII